MTLEDFNEAWNTCYREALELGSRYAGRNKTEYLLEQMHAAYQALHKKFIAQGYNLVFIYPRFSGIDQSNFELYVADRY